MNNSSDSIETAIRLMWILKLGMIKSLFEHTWYWHSLIANSKPSKAAEVTSLAL